jgi:polyphosphate kinase 2
MPDTRDDRPETNGKLKRKGYEQELTRLHVEFVKLQQWVVHKGLKVCILFEGRDGAGKGGTIKAMTERVTPRIFRVVALPAPTEREKSQMYAQRYIPHLPAAGEVVIFDRSWYNRAGVERVMGFCTEEEAKRFLEMVPVFEKVVVDSGIILLKYWLEVSPEEQTRRLEACIDDGRKIWKLPDMDLIIFALVRLFAGARRDVPRLRHLVGAVVCRPFRQQAAGAAQRPHSHPEQDPLRGAAARKPRATQRQHHGDYKEVDYPFRVIPEAF